MSFYFSDLLGHLDNSRKILHIGSHMCEERDDYARYGFQDDKVVWVEANPKVASKAMQKYPNATIYNFAASDKDGEEIQIKITNNSVSSSILDLHDHKRVHPNIVEIESIPVKTAQMDTLLESDAHNFDLVVLDIQGAELMALKGMVKILSHTRFICTEINLTEVYKGCALLPELDEFLSLHGFNRVDTKIWNEGIYGDAVYSRKDNFTIVTGASSNHYKSAMQFLSTTKQYAPNTRIVFYSLGLSEEEVQTIKTKYPEIKVDFFDFLRYPNYFDINVEAGQYAWKPIIIRDVMDKYGGMIFWCDAGNKLLGPLDPIKRYLLTSKCGIYSPHSSGTISTWTHPLSLERMGINVDLNNSPRNGAIVAFNSHNPIADSVSKKWMKCALDKGIIAPEGSSRSNHRQDQAILTILMYSVGIEDGTEYLNVSIHNDCD